MALMYRLGQILVFILIGAACAGILVSLFFPWYVDTTNVAILGVDTSCQYTYFTYWTKTVTECSGCGVLQPWCGGGDKDWRENCLSSRDAFTQGSANCMRQYYVWMSTFGLTIITAFFLACALIAYLVHILGCWRSGWALGALSFSLALAVGVLLIFSVGLPFAINTDENEKAGRAWDTQCGGGPCKEFLGTRTLEAGAGTRRWGPGLGWIINVASSCFLLIVLIVFAVFGRGGDNWVRPASRI